MADADVGDCRDGVRRGNEIALHRQVSAEQIATASGLFNTFDSIGPIASSAIVAMSLHAGVSDAPHNVPNPIQ